MVPIKEEPSTPHYQDLYSSHSPEISSEVIGRSHGSYDWSTPPSMSSHTSSHSSRLSLSSHSSIEDLTRSKWDEAIHHGSMSSNSPSVTAGFVMDHSHQYQNHRRLISAPAMFQQNMQHFVPVSQGWSDKSADLIDATSTTSHQSFSLSPMMPVRSVMSHGMVHASTSMDGSPHRSSSTSSSGSSSLTMPLQVDASTGSAMVYNALNQGSQVTLVFH
jgi:hypothetical protein